MSLYANYDIEKIHIIDGYRQKLQKWHITYMPHAEKVMCDYKTARGEEPKPTLRFEKFDDFLVWAIEEVGQ